MVMFRIPDSTAIPMTQIAVAVRRCLRRVITPLNVSLAVVCAAELLLCTTAIAFLWPRSVQFGFAKPTCFVNPTIFPGLTNQTASQTFVAKAQPAIIVAGHVLYAHTTCLTPVSTPRPGTANYIKLTQPGFGPLHKTIRVTTAALPSVDFRSPLAKPITTTKSLYFRLSTPDQVFTYQLLANDRRTTCTKSTNLLVCNMAPLQLEQSANYTLAMQQTFAGHRTTLFSQTVTTVGAVQLASSTIVPNQTVFDVPTHLTLTFNKPIRSYTGAQLVSLDAAGASKKITSKITASGNTLDVTFAAPLARNTAFEVRVQAITAPDGGHLPAPFVLAFATSGGPKVQSVSIGSYRVSPGSNITLTFDTTVASGQNLPDYIQLVVNGSTVATSLTRRGNQVIMNPAIGLPRCTRFTIQVQDGLQNDAGVAGGSAWSFDSRTLCYTTFSLGTSVKGRDITAYKFGSGGSLVVFAGNIHGNEKSSNYTLTSWIDYLERNYDSIPTGHTIVVIPLLNPDGFSAGTRTNAHNVDLNRNFPASSWKQSITMPGGVLNPNGGGPSPLSEPESSAFASYIASTHPRLVLTYHSKAGIVEPNDAGDSDSLAHTYDSKSNLNYSGTAQNDTVFAYDTTGSFEDWARQAHNTPVLLVELWTDTANEFSKNQAAMWYMAAQL